MGVGIEGEYKNGVVIHFSDRFPVVQTACGKCEPSTSVWEYVSCQACVEMRVAYREVREEVTDATVRNHGDQLTAR